MGYCYFPLLKTRKAELTALANIDIKTLDNILPIFELTKSNRSVKSNPNASVIKNIENIQNIMKDKPFILDFTTITSLSNLELDNFLEEYNGFDNWVKFIKKIKKEYSLKIIPTIVFNPYVLDDVKQQIEKLLNLVPYIACRFSFVKDKKEDKDIDIIEIIEYIKKISNMLPNKNQLIVICDLKYDLSIDLSFLDTLKKYNTIIIGSSFPKVFNSKLSTNQEHMWKFIDLSKNFPNIYYGDYASIHPIVYDNKAYQWRARIDFINSQGYSFYRCQDAPSSGETSYQYVELAKNVCANSTYKDMGCWGNQMIQNASQGYPQQATPNFWISVRVNMYINYILALLKGNVNEMSDLDI